MDLIRLQAKITRISPQPSKQAGTEDKLPFRSQLHGKTLAPSNSSACKEQTKRNLDCREFERIYELPLLELFTKLREAGLQLDINQYQLVLQAMQAGFGISDQAALKRLCQTIWVKSAKEIRLLEVHFEQCMGSKAVFSKPEALAPQSRQRTFSQIAPYVILSILEVGIVLGVGSSSKELTQTESLSQIEIINPSQTVNSIHASSFNNISLSNEGSTQINWVALALIIVGVSSAIYILSKWVVWRIAQPRIGHSTSILKPPSSAPASDPLALLTQTLDDEVQVFQAERQAISKNEEIPHNRLIVNSSEYFPVTHRQMKQIWRHLRRPIREGALTELDVQATVNQIGRQGLLFEPVLVPSRVNRAELLLLIDQDGSMVPFHALSRRLIETALRGGCLGKAGIYHFHNCPIEYLYYDPNHQEAELVKKIVTDVCSHRTSVLIFSDAGAARRSYSKERYELTKEFITQLKQQVRYIAWLNPMPSSRWLGTTASEIASLLPMFEVSRRGMQDAINVLRGGARNSEGRRL